MDTVYRDQRDLSSRWACTETQLGCSGARVIRILKLFRHFKSASSVVDSLFRSSEHVTGALVVLLMLNSTMAGIAASFLTEEGLEECFGSFSSSFLTMWQVGTGDSWTTVTRSSQQFYGTWIMVVFTGSCSSSEVCLIISIRSCTNWVSLFVAFAHLRIEMNVSLPL